MLMSTGMLSNHLILCCPLLLLPSIFPSIMVFSNELALCTGWPRYWGFSFSSSPSKEYSGLISFRIDWFDFLAVQGFSRVLLGNFICKNRGMGLIWLVAGLGLLTPKWEFLLMTSGYPDLWRLWNDEQMWVIITIYWISAAFLPSWPESNDFTHFNGSLSFHPAKVKGDQLLFGAWLIITVQV